MFRGATKITLDDKGRMVMPTRYREQIERKLMSLPSLNATARRLQRLMVGHATDLPLDGHGRVLLPAELREFAKLGRHGMLIGQGNRFELWDETRWNERRDAWLASVETPTDLPSELESLSI